MLKGKENEHMWLRGVPLGTTWYHGDQVWISVIGFLLILLPKYSKDMFVMH